MDLQEFIKQSLVAIVRGIEGANKEIGESTFRRRVGDRDDWLEFDIAVTVTKAHTSPQVLGAEFGEDGSKSHSDRTVSRIKFKVGNGGVIG